MHLSLSYENGQKIYKDAFGNKYQYNLDNPCERLSYSTDLDARMRDDNSTNPTRQLNGGGIYE